MQMTAFTSYVLMLQYLNLVAEVTAFNVLIVSGTDTGSHQASLSAMFTRFAQAGHHVYLFDSSNPKPVEYGYSNIHTLSAYIQPNLTERAEKIAKFWRLPFRSISPSGMQIWGDELLGRFIDDHSEVLTAIMKLKIDLIVIDEIKVHPSAIAEQFHELHGVPFIDFWTTEPYNHLNEVLNIQYDLIIADPIFSPNAFSLSMRLKNERDVPYLFYSPSGEVTVAVTEPMSLDKKAAEIGGLKAIHTYIPVESRKNTEVKWSGSMKVTDFLNLYKLRDHSFGRLLDLYPNKVETRS
ncbi:hypothetical protein M3Y96_01190700 [Aphelenchoides besseyi]|nr:hypothetical protein M3Y96_01190700 [Aphelenchoides besseyi]